MKKSRFLSNLLAIVFFIFLQICLILTAFDVMLLRSDFLLNEVLNYNVAQDLNSTDEEMEKIVNHLMKVTNGSDEDLSEVTFEMGGETTHFFNERDILHMSEIRELVFSARVIYGAFIAITVILGAALILLYKKGHRFSLKLGYIISIIIASSIAAVILIYAFVDTHGFIWTFHELLFTSDTWILDPQADYLIWLFPENLFADGAVVFCEFWGICNAVIIALLVINKVFSKRFKRIG